MSDFLERLERQDKTLTSKTVCWVGDFPFAHALCWHPAQDSPTRWEKLFWFGLAGFCRSLVCLLVCWFVGFFDAFP